MSVSDVKKFFEDHNLSFEIMELEDSTATVELAAAAHNVVPDQIAKSIALYAGDEKFLLVTSGMSRLDNKKFKATFKAKPRMMSAEDVLEATGHPVGGVCPFGLKTEMKICLDASLKRFDTVFPAAGAHNASIEISPERLKEITHGTWVDVCKNPEAETHTEASS
ncbi:YbaK/EbsC family protein [Acidaminobacter hydrogenoformans]|uniref:Cys-tRNA(Pro) deacylase, prolyl-tRNA editing enzyme YbaK/EbsC n=1 Tax=Acidaminobacter hydrogenoformans DSM 2784 TaxID=1120920 RepID=A0A1G5RZC6_9FIRM|nr:YbaK/EbsC family protein [Acidaminobacter hydrogenoformans]SCZ79356.1 Cys-tRNA(Pro) deacylase, prolyl-tRNA editing enzyme YbaK/EbsC [Acidaminobacter hydrogenoformans DSM 2784]